MKKYTPIAILIFILGAVALIAGNWYVTSTTTAFVIEGLGVWPEATEIKFNYFNPQ